MRDMSGSRTYTSFGPDYGMPVRHEALSYGRILCRNISMKYGAGAAVAVNMDDRRESHKRLLQDKDVGKEEAEKLFNLVDVQIKGKGFL